MRIQGQIVISNTTRVLVQLLKSFDVLWHLNQLLNQNKMKEKKQDKKENKKKKQKEDFFIRKLFSSFQLLKQINKRREKKNCGKWRDGDSEQRRRRQGQGFLTIVIVLLPRLLSISVLSTIVRVEMIFCHPSISPSTNTIPSFDSGQRARKRRKGGRREKPQGQEEIIKGQDTTSILGFNLHLILVVTTYQPLVHVLGG